MPARKSHQLKCQTQVESTLLSYSDNLYAVSRRSLLCCSTVIGSAPLDSQSSNEKSRTFTYMRNTKTAALPSITFERTETLRRHHPPSSPSPPLVYGHGKDLSCSRQGNHSHIEARRKTPLAPKRQSYVQVEWLNVTYLTIMFLCHLFFRRSQRQPL